MNIPTSGNGSDTVLCRTVLEYSQIMKRLGRPGQAARLHGSRLGSIGRARGPSTNSNESALP